MTTDGEQVLEKLEVISSEIAGLLDTPSSVPEVLERTGPLLTERAKLIAELAAVLTSGEDLSYQQYNRLLIICAQGGQIASSLIAQRSALSELVMQAQRKRAYADRLRGMIGNEAVSCRPSA